LVVVTSTGTTVGYRPRDNPAAFLFYDFLFKWARLISLLVVP